MIIIITIIDEASSKKVGLYLIILVLNISVSVVAFGVVKKIALLLNLDYSYRLIFSCVSF